MCYKKHIAKCASDLYTHSAPRRLRTYNCHDIVRIKEPRSRLDLLLVNKIVRAKVQNIFNEVNNLVFRNCWNLEHFPHVIPMRRCDHSKELTVKFITLLFQTDNILYTLGKEKRLEAAPGMDSLFKIRNLESLKLAGGMHRSQIPRSHPRGPNWGLQWLKNQPLILRYVKGMNALLQLRGVKILRVGGKDRLCHKMERLRLLLSVDRSSSSGRLDFNWPFLASTGL